MTLRERKKTMTRSAIEDTGIRMFAERGFEAVRVDDICEAVLVHRRTFFRYFTSKEDVVLARFRRDLAEAAANLSAQPASTLVADMLAAVCDEIAPRFEHDRDIELTRLRLIASAPSLAAAYLKVLQDFEHMLRVHIAPRPQAPLLAAAAVAAFRVALEEWQDADGEPSLRLMARRNIELLTVGIVTQLADSDPPSRTSSN